MATEDFEMIVESFEKELLRLSVTDKVIPQCIPQPGERFRAPASIFTLVLDKRRIMGCTCPVFKPNRKLGGKHLPLLCCNQDSRVFVARLFL